MRCSGGSAGVALDHAVLHLDGAAHRIDDAAEFDDAAVAGALDDPTVMDRDRWVDEVAAEGPEASEDAIFVRARKPAVADDVGHQNRDELAAFAHLTLRPLAD